MASPGFIANTRLRASDLNAAFIAAADGLYVPYQRVTPTTGATVTLVSADRILIIDPAGALAALTVVLTAGVEKRRMRIITRQRIDALTITPAGGDSVDWSVNELPQYGRLEFLYVTGITTWVLI